MTVVPQFSLLDQTFEHVNGGRKIFKSLAERDELNTAADGVEFALDIFDSPAVERQRRILHMPCNSAILMATAFGSVARPGMSVGARPAPTSCKACCLRLHAPSVSRPGANKTE